MSDATQILNCGGRIDIANRARVAVKTDKQGDETLMLLVSTITQRGTQPHGFGHHFLFFCVWM